MELLPAQRDLRITQQSKQLDERTIDQHDAALIICDPAIASTLRQLPYGNVLEQTHERVRSQTPVSLLSTHVGTRGIPLVVVFAKPTASAFERLSAGGRAWKALAAPSCRKLLIATWQLDAGRSRTVLESFLAAALAGAAPLPQFKSKPSQPTTLESITLCGEGASTDVSRTLATHRGNHIARWLATLPPNVLNSAGYRTAVRTLAKRQGWTFEFLNAATLRRLGAGAFLAVARSNDHEDAGIVRVRRRARDRNTVRGKVALVGKGICFDTGGINLKPPKAMLHMHEDMQGSAVALGLLTALTQIDAPYDIDCWLAITENSIGPHAYRPQEVITAANGTTIQVMNSDAEGRMVLADTLALAARDKPALILDFATLTGACVWALTERYGGVFTNRSDWHAALERAGRDSGERVWPFPMDDDFDSDLESSVADVLQCTVDSKGDHIYAARFLKRFVPDETPWIHVDLAASNRAGGLGHIPSDFTGFGVRFGVELLLEHGLIAKPRSTSRKRRA